MVVATSTRPSPRISSDDERQIAWDRLQSTTSKSMRKRQGALTPPPVPPMTPTRHAARISRLQHLTSPSTVRTATELEPSPETNRRRGITLSRAERLKAQERLTSPAVPAKLESPECSERLRARPASERIKELAKPVRTCARHPTATQDETSNTSGYDYTQRPSVLVVNWQQKEAAQRARSVELSLLRTVSQTKTIWSVDTRRHILPFDIEDLVLRRNMFCGTDLWD